jgi:hypothetical protein
MVTWHWQLFISTLKSNAVRRVTWIWGKCCFTSRNNREPNCEQSIKTTFIMCGFLNITERRQEFRKERLKIQNPAKTPTHCSLMTLSLHSSASNIRCLYCNIFMHRCSTKEFTLLSNWNIAEVIEIKTRWIKIFAIEIILNIFT